MDPNKRMRMEAAYHVLVSVLQVILTKGNEAVNEAKVVPASMWPYDGHYLQNSFEKVYF